MAGEPALYLTNPTGLIVNTMNLMGKLTTLLQWNAADPVDVVERLRNDAVYSYQTNRNPFVDHPEWVNLTFAPPHTNPPVLKIADASPGGLLLSWVATNQSTRLQFSTNVAAGWADSSLSPVLTNSEFLLPWTNQMAPAFFRLRTW